MVIFGLILLYFTKMKVADVKNLAIPASPGSYQFYNRKNEVIYVGKAVDLRARVLSYWRQSSGLTPIKERMLEEISAIKWLTVDSEIEALLLEANLIKKYQPEYNVLMRDDKRHIYIKVSLSDEVPGVFATRQIDKSGHYFGPFISARAVRETLKAIRRIWPYCSARKISDKPCFYYHLGRCTGVCGGLIGRDEYLKTIIKPIIAFLEGKKSRALRVWRRELKNLENDGQTERAELLRARLLSVKQVLDNARVLSVAEKYENDVVELAKLLGLPKIPLRIEGYDLSTLFGRESVGSMVVFAEGEPDKNEYRKFKIKSEVKGDTDMLKEILERRFNNDWPKPDLIIIDGGKAQLNAAQKIVDRRAAGIVVIAISKGEGLRTAQAPDKLFFAGQSKPLILPLASPALHLVKRVRDEAHRFAISYHRNIRGKRMFD